MILLVSLGTSPAIVPEAFLLPGVEFTSVHVLTTESTSLDFVVQWFRDHAPGVPLTITRVAGFSDFQSEEDHFHFEEVLYRWWLQRTGGTRPHVCLTGGFKTMSAAVQKAAAFFGAEEVFHVLADTPYQTREGRPRPAVTAEEIAQCLELGGFRWIRLGAESGWPQFHSVTADDFPLAVESPDSAVSLVRAPDHRLRERIREVVERSHNIAGVWDSLATLPFANLATWQPARVAWLNEPLDAALDRAWVASLPKIDLHCHLGGFATHGDLLREVREAASHPEQLPPLAEPVPPQDWPLPAAPVGLETYRHLGDANGSAILKDEGCLKRHIDLLYRHFQSENLVHAEVRCSPANYAAGARTPWLVLTEIRNHFERCRIEAGEAGMNAPLVNLILIATRQTGGDFRTGILRHVSLAATAFEHWTDDSATRVVGVDLAGFEDRLTRAHYFRDDFMPALRLGMGITVHAGENDDAEGIWSAILDLNARRLGHALHLADSPSLLRSVADRRICIEMCPHANLQIVGYPLDCGDETHSKIYPLKRYLDAGVSVTVNTDNIGISSASITDNLLLTARLCPGITRLDILKLVRHSFDHAFHSPAGRKRLLEQIHISPCT